MMVAARKMIETSIDVAVSDISQLPPVNWSFWMAKFLLELRNSLKEPGLFDSAWEGTIDRVERVITNEQEEAKENQTHSGG